MNQATEKPPRDEAAVRLYMHAYEEYQKLGKSLVRCDQCGAVIEFRRLSDQADESSCMCGKYNGTLRGI